MVKRYSAHANKHRDRTVDLEMEDRAFAALYGLHEFLSNREGRQKKSHKKKIKG